MLVWKVLLWNINFILYKYFNSQCLLYFNKGDVLHHGFLLKESKGVRRDWSLRHFVLTSDTVECWKVSKDVELQETASVLLLHASIRPNESRRFVFEIVSPQTHWSVAAASQAEMNSWLDALAKQTAVLLSESAVAS